MVKRQPVKNVSGAGFSFEDMFGAYLAAALLAGARLLDIQLGPPVRIDFQTEADGWRLDDVVVTFEDGTKWAASVKSYPQIDGGKALSDFVTRAWEDLSGASESGFDIGRDLVGMVTAPVDQESWRDLNELIRLSRGQDSADLAGRIQQPGYASEERRKLWDGFARPTSDALRNHRPELTEPAELLSRLRAIDVDFESSPSVASARGLKRCEDALVDPADAPRLWDALLTAVPPIRTAGGYLDWPKLRGILGERFDLRIAPSYTGDWLVLNGLSSANLGLVADTLHGTLHLDRTEALEHLDGEVDESERFVALVGPSGWGKTALAKQWAAASGSSIVWLLPADVAALIGTASPLRHALADVLRSSPRPGWIVVDGLDRSFTGDADRGVSLLAALIRDDASVPFRLVITAQQQSWPGVAERLASNNTLVEWKVVAAPAIGGRELQVLYDAFPPLADIAIRNRLSRVLKNLKVLDVVLRHLSETSGGALPAGDEASFAEWFWEYVALGTGAHRARRAGFLLRLAEGHADSLEPDTSLLAVDAAELEIADDLGREGVCQIRDERIRFEHDLFGDWIRLRLLRNHADDLRQYLSTRITSPLWHRAIRLRAIELLGLDDGAAAWSEEMHRLSDTEPGLLDDLFLEAPLFASDPISALNRVWPRLSDDNGHLLRRLLRRFRHVATIPNPALIASIRESDADLELHAATLQRLPFWPLWLALLRTLATHEQEVVSKAGQEAAEVVDLWLRFTPDDWPLRDEAAHLAIAIAQKRLADEHRGSRSTSNADVATWRAMLAAARERPEDVRNLAEALCGRRPSTEVGEDDEIHPLFPGPRHRSRTPRADDAFLHVCLDADGLHPVIRARPELASDILLWLLAPRERDRFGLWDDLGMDRIPGWLIPLYTRGPFLVFLKHSAPEALSMIVRLTESATDRWVANRTEDGEPPRPIAVRDESGVIEMRGGSQVFVWYRGDGRAPDVLASALMALEKWLYDEIDAGRDVSPAVADILQTTRSVALLGLLVAVGCRQPILFSGPLLPLLGTWELQMWDREHKTSEPLHLAIGLFREPAAFQQLAQQWYSLEHRRLMLVDLTTQLVLTVPDVAEYLSTTRDRWRQDLDDQGQPVALRYLIAQLDPANWTPSQGVEGNLVLEYGLPEDLKDDAQETARDLDRRFFWLNTPMQCRRILDGEASITEEELEPLWLRLQGAGTVPPDLTLTGVLGDDDSKCGVAALLLLRHRKWLRDHPERERWCIDALVEAVGRTRPTSFADYVSDGASWSWDAFSAEAIPALWAENPASPELTSAVARLALSFHDVTIAHLFRSAAQFRKVLGDDFRRLQHLAVRVAQWQLQRRRATGSGQSASKADAALGRILDSFLDRTLEAQVPGWAELAVPDPDSRPRRRGTEMDLGYLQAAYQWMPDLADAVDDREREDWIAYWLQSVEAMVRRLRRDMNLQRDEVDGTPFEDEYLLLRELPARILQFPADQRENLWGPILALGSAAHYWIDSFLDQWFWVGLSDAASEEFLGEWKRMLKFVHGEEIWSGQRAYRASELHARLMGMGSMTTRLWISERVQIAAGVKDEFEHWATVHLSGEWETRDLARFLSQPGAEPLLRRGIVHLDRADAALSSRGCDEDYYDAVGSLLARVSQRHADLAHIAEEPGVAFRQLLTRMAGRQNPVALEILSRMSAPS